MSEKAEGITWKWIAGIAGILLFALATAWAARVESAVAEVQSLQTSVQFIRGDIAEIKEILREALRK